jgi:flagellar hook-associated protein 3 FlgL
MAELLMRSKIEENIYNASLAVGAKIIVPSLVDFLR